MTELIPMLKFSAIFIVAWSALTIIVLKIIDKK